MKTSVAQIYTNPLDILLFKWQNLRCFWLEFRKLTNEQIDTIVKDLSKKRKKEEKDPLIRCRNCGYTITTTDDVISVAGQHRHTFKNPAGILYSIGCFARAEGCFDLGEPTSEFTWFPGYSWSYSVCKKCFTHMGWFYRSGESTFYGLILKQLEGGINTDR